MSVQLIQQYHAQVDKIIRYGGSRKETSVRKPFQDLLEAYARQKNLELIAELDYRTRTGHTVYPDGTLKDALRQDWGYWESKDEADDLDQEIANKFAKGYPANNILFEDTQTAVLYQANEEVARVDFLDAAALDAVLAKFVSYESQEVREFREAIENFTRDIPDLGEMLRDAIRQQYEQNASFQKATQDFLELCQEAINPSMELADVREMIVQHVLTEDIFITIFDEPASAWAYKLGNRSALEWVLDRYKERKPRDPTIRAQFNSYRFADYKEDVIDLLCRVCTVSVETMKIVNVMPEDIPQQKG